MLLSVRGGSFSFFIGISRFYTFLSVGERRRGIVGVFRAVPRTTLSEPPSQTVTYDKYAPVCLGGSSLFFIGISRFYTFLSVGERRRGIVGVFRAVPRTTLSEPPSQTVTYNSVRSCLFGRLFRVLHRNIAVLHVSFCGREKTRDCRCFPRCSANNFVRDTLASSHVRQVRSCLFGRRRGPQNFGIAEFWGGLGVLHRNARAFPFVDFGIVGAPDNIIQAYAVKIRKSNERVGGRNPFACRAVHKRISRTATHAGACPFYLH